MTLRIDIHQAPAWVAQLSKEMRAGARKGLYSAALRTQQLIVGEIIPQTKPMPVDTGAYKAAWRVSRTEDGASLENTLPYAPVIEYGARAQNIKIGRAMIDALAAWVRRKGIGGSGKGRNRKPASEGDARSIAWAIAMSMKRRGIFNGGRGLRVLERAAARIPALIQEEIARELDKLR